MAAAWIRPAGEQGPPPGHLRFVNEGGYEVTYRCSCSRGLSDPRAFPTYRGGA